MDIVAPDPTRITTMSFDQVPSAAATAGDNIDLSVLLNYSNYRVVCAGSTAHIQIRGFDHTDWVDDIA